MAIRIKSSPSRRTSKPKRSLLRFESLEHRDVPATFMVLNAGDNGGVDPVVGAATGTLRQAIVDAGASDGEDDIKFDAAAFANPATITLENDLPAIKNGRLNIKGPGVNLLTINGGGNFSLLANDSSARVLQVQDMTLTGGSGSLGGAITVDPATEAFFLLRSKVTGNTGLKAGGIYLNPQSVQTQIIDSTISNNTGPTGGILSLGFNASLYVHNSTISGNTGTSDDPKAGGGIAFAPSNFGFRLEVLNSTIHGNSSLNKNGGAGILLFGEGLSVNNYIVYSTVTGNTSPTDSISAGGVSLIDPDGDSSDVSLNIFTSVIAENVGTADSPDLTSQRKVDAFTSYIGVRPRQNFTDDKRTLSGDPKLGPLQDNGGPTQTRMPNADSPLIDSAGGIVDSNGNPILTKDQRGSPRKVNDIHDIGSVEHPIGDTTKPTVTIVPAPNQSNPETDDTIEFAVQFDQNVQNFVASDVDFTGSTVGGTLVATIIQITENYYIVAVTGMSDLGNVVASLKADAGIDWAGNGSVASSNSNNVVGFSSVGRIAFTVGEIQTEEGKNVVITAVRTGIGDGTASANLEFVAGTAVAADYTVPAGSFTWEAGETGAKSLTVAINDDAKNESIESFTVKLSGLAGSIAMPAIGLAEAKVTIDRSDAAAVDGTHKFLFKDEDGDKVTVKLSGSGTAKVSISDPDDDGQGDIDRIELLNTNEKSTLTIGVARVGDGLLDVGHVYGPSLKALNAPKANLVGKGVLLSGYLGALSLNSISNGADIEGNGSPTQMTKITVKGTIGDGSDITISNNLSKLSAGSFADTDAGTDIFANSIGSLTINGNFSGDIQVTGDGVDHAKGKNSIGSINVKGAMNDSAVTVTGNIGSVSVYDFVNSRIYGGYSPFFGFSNGANAIKTTIGSFKTAANKRLGMTGKFENSSIYADKIKKATLANVITSNNGSGLGLIVDTSYESVTFTINGVKSITKKSAEFEAIGDFDIVVR